MATGCGFKCAKYLLFVFNFIFWCAGAVLLGIGIWFLVDSSALRVFNINSVSTTDGLIRAAAIAIVVVGGLMFIVGGFGCFGACTENATLLIIFATILFILLAGQVAAGVLAGVYREQLMTKLQDTMNKTVQNEYGRKADVTAAWDLVQIEWQCCGVLELSEWSSSYWYQQIAQNISQSVPGSCCIMNGTGLNRSPINSTACNLAANLDLWLPINRADYLNTKGCYNSLIDWVKQRLAIIIGVAIGLVLIQIVGIILACCLGHSIRNKNVYK